MTKKEKFEFLCNSNPDKYPGLFQPILMHFAARFNGKTYAQFASDYRVLVDSNLKALDYFDMDMVGLISDPYRETSAFGAQIEFLEEGVPQCLRSIIKDIDDVRELRIPDVYKSERCMDRINGAKLFQKYLKGKVPVYGWIEGPLAESCDLAGVGEILLSLIANPDFVNLLMDKCMVTAKDFARAQIEAGCDIIGVGDAICSQISNDLYNDYVKERHIELIEFIHSLHARVKMHICGDINHLLPSLKELNIDILDIDWKVDPENAHKTLGEQVFICGNINPVDIQEMNETDLIELTRIIIQKEKGHRFVLSGGCEITVNTPVRNLKVMSETVKKVNQ